LLNLNISKDEFYIKYNYYCIFIKGTACRLGGVVISVFATGPKGHGFKPGRGDGFLRVIKICSMPSFRWEVKLEVPCLKILQHVKDPLGYFRY
jgi:hypothetical protein